MPKLYTIGYATKPIETFIAQLKTYQIDVVADVRSVPYSKIFYDYHKESIAGHLRRSSIRYVYLGEELGPRSKDDKHYDETGQVQFDRLMMSELFHQGIDRLQLGLSKDFNIALMCAEKDPAICHRSLLLGYFLLRHFSGIKTESAENINSGCGLKSSNGLASDKDTDKDIADQLVRDTLANVSHITHDGHIETQEQLEQRVLEINGKGDDLFMSEDECKYQAYHQQLKNTSYRKGG